MAAEVRALPSFMQMEKRLSQKGRWIGLLAAVVSTRLPSHLAKGTSQSGLTLGEFQARLHPVVVCVRSKLEQPGVFTCCPRQPEINLPFTNP